MRLVSHTGSCSCFGVHDEDGYTHDMSTGTNIFCISLSFPFLCHILFFVLLTRSNPFCCLSNTLLCLLVPPGLHSSFLSSSFPLCPAPHTLLASLNPSLNNQFPPRRCPSPSRPHSPTSFTPPPPDTALPNRLVPQPPGLLKTHDPVATPATAVAQPSMS